MYGSREAINESLLLSTFQTYNRMKINSFNHIKTITSLLILFFVVILSCEKSEKEEEIFQFIELNGEQFQFNNLSYFILMHDAASVKLREKELSLAVERGEIISFNPMYQNAFLVFGKKRITNPADYISNIYYNNKNEMMIILPDIIIFLKENQHIENVVTDYTNKLTLKEHDRSRKYIFNCHVNSSEEIIDIVNKISSKNSVDWCEPNILSNFHTQD